MNDPKRGIALILVFSGCSAARDFTLDVPFDSALLIAISESADAVSSIHGVSGERVSLDAVGEDFVTFVVPDALFLTDDATPASLDSVVARLDGEPSPQGSCGFCPTEREASPYFTAEGADCPLPEESLAFRGDASVDVEEVRALFDQIRLDWPGPCACEAQAETRSRGPLQPLDGRWPVRHALALPSGETLLVGRRVVRTSSAGVIRESAATVQNGCTLDDGLGVDISFAMRRASSNDALLVVRETNGARSVLELNTEELTVGSRFEAPAIEPWAYLSDDAGRVVIAGSGVVRIFATGMLTLCETDTGFECKDFISTGATNSRLDRVARAGDGLVAVGPASIVVIRGWPSIDNIGDVSGVDDPSTTIPLRDGTEIPAFQYDAQTAEVRIGPAFVAGAADRAVFCSNYDNGARASVMPLGPNISERPTLTEGPNCNGLRCAAVVSAFGEEAMLAVDSAERVQVLMIDEAARLGESCRGRTLDGLYGVERVSVGSTGLLIVDGRRRVAKLDSWSAEIEWIEPGPDRPAVEIAKSGDETYVYTEDGGIDRISDGVVEPVGRIEVSGLVTAAARSSLGDHLLISHDGMTRTITWVDETLEASVVAQMPVAVFDSNTNIRWVGPDTAILLADRRIFEVRREGVEPVDVAWDIERTQEIETEPTGRFSFEGMAGSASRVLAYGPSGLAVVVDPFAGPSARRLEIVLEGPGAAGFDEVNIDAVRLNPVQPICPGVFRVMLERSTLARARAARSQKQLLVRPIERVDLVNRLVKDVTAGPQSLEAGLFADDGDVGGGVVAFGLDPILTDVAIRRVVDDPSGLIALGTDGRLYRSAPCP